MAIKVRQTDLVWTIDLHETWYFSEAAVALMGAYTFEQFHEFACRHKIPYKIGEVFNGQFGVHIVGCNIKCDSYEDMLLKFAEVSLWKSERGHRIEVKE